MRQVGGLLEVCVGALSELFGFGFWRYHFVVSFSGLSLASVCWRPVFWFHRGASLAFVVIVVASLFVASLGVLYLLTLSCWSTKDFSSRRLLVCRLVVSLILCLLFLNDFGGSKSFAFAVGDRRSWRGGGVMLASSSSSQSSVIVLQLCYDFVCLAIYDKWFIDAISRSISHSIEFFIQI
ncbi:hypothetical protein C8J56DRAFT_359312 [Mycena floridula]|nr:hypothetical protein C8J56DRAFT_359312 [Mycena floridula]